MKDSKRKIILGLLKFGVINLDFNNYFLWTSGLKSPIYCDFRKLNAFPKLRSEILDYIILKNKIKELKINLIIGVANSGISWGAYLAEKLTLPFAYVLKKPKEHGTKKFIEGANPNGCHALLIEDVISTGNSLLLAYDALSKEYANLTLQLTAIFSYQLDKSKKSFEAKALLPFICINFSDLIVVIKEEKFITDDESQKLINFMKELN